MLVGVAIISVLLAAFGCVLGFVLLSAVRQNEADDRWTEHTHQVLTGVAAILTSAADAETGQRGFLLTSDPRYLEPYDNGIKNIWNNFLNVENMSKDNAGQQSRLQVLRGLLESRLTILSRTIELARTHDVTAALDMVREGQGKALMDDIRKITADLVAEEERLLLIRRTHSASAQRWSEALLIFFGSCSVLVGGIAIVFPYVAMHSRRRLAAIASALRSSEARLRRFVDDAPAAIAMLDSDMRYLAATGVTPPAASPWAITRSTARRP